MTNPWLSLVVNEADFVQVFGKVSYQALGLKGKRVDQALICSEWGFQRNVYSTADAYTFELSYNLDSPTVLTEGTLLRVIGYWNGANTLEVESATAVNSVVPSLSPVLPIDSGPLRTGAESAGRPIHDLLQTQVIEARDDLLEMGALLRLGWNARSEEDIEWLATAFDVEEVERVLKPHFPAGRFRVEKSRWSASELKRAYDGLRGAGDDLVSLGTRITSDGNEIVTATVRRVSVDLAHALDGLPGDMLEVDSVLLPAHAEPHGAILD